MKYIIAFSFLFAVQIGFSQSYYEHEPIFGPVKSIRMQMLDQDSIASGLSQIMYFDTIGQLIQTNHYSNNGSLIISENYIYHYPCKNCTGRIALKLNYSYLDTKQSLSGYAIYKHNANHLEQVSVFDGNASLWGEYFYSHTSDTIRIRENHTIPRLGSEPTATLVVLKAERIVQIYTFLGDKIASEGYFEYEAFDQYNNWTKRRSFAKGIWNGTAFSAQKVTERQIEYYRK